MLSFNFWLFFFFKKKERRYLVLGETFLKGVWSNLLLSIHDHKFLMGF